jgi:hypothetical protein
MCWHKWGKWEQYKQEGTITSYLGRKVDIPYSELRQKRKCIKCNKEQDERY